MALPISMDTSLRVGLKNSYHGPFKSIAGDFYTVLRSRANPIESGTLSLWKNIDPDNNAFTEEAVQQVATASETLASIWCVQENDIIHSVCQKDGTATDDRNVYYVSSDMLADTMATEVTIESIVTPDDGPAANACSIAVDSTGDIVVVYQGDPEMLMGTEYARIDANKSTDGGATWSGTGFPLAIDNAGNGHWTGPVIVAGSSDRMHIFFKDDNNEEAYQRRLGSDDSLETFPSAFSVTKNASTLVYIFGHGVNAGGEISVPWRDADGESSVVSFTSADTPSYTETNNVSDNPVTFINDTPIHCMAVDGDDLHLVYSDSNKIFMHDENTGSGWGTDDPHTVSARPLLSGGVSSVGDNSAREEVAFSFTTTAAGLVSLGHFRLKKIGSPTDNLNIRIESDSSGEPSGTVLITFDVVAGTDLTTALADYIRSASSSGTLADATDYWLIFDRSTGIDSSNYYQICDSTDSDATTGKKDWNGSVWSSLSAADDSEHQLGEVWGSLFEHISANIYDRGETKLAMILLDAAGLIYYHEIQIPTAFTNLSDVKFPDQNYFVGPFDS